MSTGSLPRVRIGGDPRGLRNFWDGTGPTSPWSFPGQHRPCKDGPLSVRDHVSSYTHTSHPRDRPPSRVFRDPSSESPRSNTGNTFKDPGPRSHSDKGRVQTRRLRVGHRGGQVGTVPSQDRRERRSPLGGCGTEERRDLETDPRTEHVTQ